MLPRLISFDGIPGTGKSTFSAFASVHLTEYGYPAQCIEEHQLLTGMFANAFTAFEQRQPQFDAILETDWQHFVQTVSDSTSLFVVNGAFAIVDLYLLLAMDYPRSTIEAHVERLAPMIAPLRPLVIHLRGDTEQIMQHTMRVRGGTWTTYITRFINGFPYQQARDRTGVIGMIAFLHEAQTLVDDLLCHAAFNTLQIDVTAGAWEQYQERIVHSLTDK